MMTNKFELPSIQEDGFRYVTDGAPLTVGITFAQGPLQLNGKERELIVQDPEYERRFKELGANVIALLSGTNIDWALRQCHAVVIAGGHDPDVGLFGHPAIVGAEDRLVEARERTQMEVALLNRMEAEATLLRPVLGVCYGSQVLALREGATLKRIYGHEDGPHSLTFVRSFLGTKAGKTYHYDSRHGLAIAKLPESFELCATYGDEVEAFVHRELPFYGIQAHPETPLPEDYTRSAGVGWEGKGMYEEFLRQAYVLAKERMRLEENAA
ncbi:gamma-glutamyl-gamma-aminobutyrate hydrolase family protein [Candidatus Saccharibacteria bacterium]|nr:gamma-glutamyl-gamma-aminobutyrate hydrolase family protein [Candidatus Saccharibacteria bacterium]